MPNMTGATREMIKIACGNQSAPARYDRGYGNADFSSTEYTIDDETIRMFRLLWHTMDKWDAEFDFSDHDVTFYLSSYCKIRSDGQNSIGFIAAFTRNIQNKYPGNRIAGETALRLGSTISTIGDKYVCPEFDRNEN
ncbi:hypothetical protein [Leptolyngbya sp. FACHB-17]|uniref:hypothetical protein n=1 Tax=unclassified Leptolyngbya TaxID=2650499 RepID=UPI0016819E3E|nr:hypothetical protein [Leptolyngbya sp. FACHB-17]MBD2079700.1 hypothetical protein [Leptolyngbya sp. FACHB-17]